MLSKKTIISFARSIIGIGVALGIIYGIIQSSDVKLWGTIVQAKFSLLILALLMFGSVACMASYRLNLLLKTQGIYLSAWGIIRLTLIGIFFNLALPGAVSGDMMKMYLLARHTTHQKEGAILTILLDRVIGLTGLFIVAFLVVIFSFDLISEIDRSHRIVKIAGYIVGIGSLFGIIFMILMGLRERVMRLSFIVWLIGHCQRVLPAVILNSIENLGSAMKLFRRNHFTIITAILISVLIHAVLALNFYCIGVGVGENVIKLKSYFISVPVANAVAALPLTPGGIGTRDLTITLFLKSMKASDEMAAAIPVIFTLVIVFWGMVGGIIFSFSRSLKFAVREIRRYGHQT
jgi:uncharacterized protein (TIRG00374 family)